MTRYDDDSFVKVAGGHLGVYVGKGEVVVVGDPSPVEDENDPSYHNCDAMGCGQWHVVYRTPVAVPSEPRRA